MRLEQILNYESSFGVSAGKDQFSSTLSRILNLLMIIKI